MHSFNVLGCSKLHAVYNITHRALGFGEVAVNCVIIKPNI